MKVKRRKAMGAVVAAVALFAVGCGSSSHKSGTAASSTTSAASSSTAAVAPSTSAAASGGSTATGGSQPGVTANSITVASVATIGGPVPGLFQGAPYGADAYFAYINSQGGVDGRQLKLRSLDDVLNCNQNKNDYANAIGSVFAFVGSMSVVANCSAPVLAAHPEVPDISWTLDTQTRALSNAFDPSPQPNGFRLGPFTYYSQHFPNNKKVGALYSNAPGSEINFRGQTAAMKTLGYTISYSRAFAPTDTSFTSDILRMKADGVNFLWLEDADFGTIDRVLTEAQQQNFKPMIFGGNNAYSPKVTGVITQAEGNGMYDDLLHAMFLGEDASTVPAVTTFLTWMKKTHPNFQPDEYTLWGWAGADLFVQALKAAGPNPTQQGVLTALRSIHSFNAHGLFAPADVGNKKPSTCYIIIQWTNGKWHRVTPQTGFQCQPGGYYYYNGS